MSGIEVLPTPEQREIVGAVARTLGDLFPIERLNHGRSTAAIGDGDWATIAELGWIGTALPADAGGVGYELTDAVLLHRLFAQQFLTPALTATVVAAKLAMDAKDLSLARELCAGQVRAAFALPCFGGQSDGEHYLLDHVGAKLFVVLAESGAHFVEVDAMAESPLEALDSTVFLTRSALAPSGACKPNPEAGLWAQALIASELAGLALAATEKAVSYAKVRHQFGKPIGSFQAVAHMCAECAMRGEAAVAQSNFAAIAIRDRRGDAAFQASAASIVAADAAFRNATANIQIHGGIGFAAESDAHLYLKRTVLLRTLVPVGPYSRSATGLSRD